MALDSFIDCDGNEICDTIGTYDDRAEGPICTVILAKCFGCKKELQEQEQRVRRTFSFRSHGNVIVITITLHKTRRCINEFANWFDRAAATVRQVLEDPRNGIDE